MRTQIDPSVLHELLRYEPTTGHLFWRMRPAKFFSDTNGEKGARHPSSQRIIP